MTAAFLVGVAVGSWLTIAAGGAAYLFARRRTRKLNEARAREMAEAIKKLFTEPTPDCVCPSCTEKRQAQARGGAN